MAPVAAPGPPASASLKMKSSNNSNHNNFRLQIRLEAKKGQPIRQIRLADLVVGNTEDGSDDNNNDDLTIDTLKNLVVKMTFDYDDDDTIMKDNANFNIDTKYKVYLKYNIGSRSDNWWVDMVTTNDLKYAIEDNHSQGYVCITANVIDKTAALLRPPPPPRAPAAVAAASSFKSVSPPIKKKAKATAAKHSEPTQKKTDSNNKKKKPVEIKILSALQELRVLQINAPPRIQVALFSGYCNTNSTGFAKALSNLKSKGCIEYPSSKSVALSQMGIKEADNSNAPNQQQPITNNDAVHERIKSLLKPKACEMFDALKDGRARNRMDVAYDSGYTNVNSTGFAKGLSTLSALGIVEYPKDETNSKRKLVQLTDIAFPFGRPPAVNNAGGPAVAAAAAAPVPPPPPGPAGGVGRPSLIRNNTMSDDED